MDKKRPFVWGKMYRQQKQAANLGKIIEVSSEEEGGSRGVSIEKKAFWKKNAPTN